MRSFSATLFVILFLSIMAPVPVLGATCSATPVVPPTTFAETLCFGASLIKSIIPLVVGATLLVFFFGMIKFIRNSGDTEAVSEGKKLMLWGIIALFVMLSIWGILNLFYSDFFGGTVGVPQLPESTKLP